MIDVAEPHAQLPPLRVIGWACDDHGLGWDTQGGTLAHEREEGCHRWRVLSLDELQRQMDRANAELREADQGVSHARSRIGEASAYFHKQRLAHDAAKERAEAANRLWAERAQTAAKQILTGV